MNVKTAKLLLNISAPPLPYGQANRLLELEPSLLLTTRRRRSLPQGLPRYVKRDLAWTNPCSATQKKACVRKRKMAPPVQTVLQLQYQSSVHHGNIVVAKSPSFLKFANVPIFLLGFFGGQAVDSLRALPRLFFPGWNRDSATDHYIRALRCTRNIRRSFPRQPQHITPLK